jgi:hypothetical protein
MVPPFHGFVPSKVNRYRVGGGGQGMETCGFHQMARESGCFRWQGFSNLHFVRLSEWSLLITYGAAAGPTIHTSLEVTNKGKQHVHSLWKDLISLGSNHHPMAPLYSTLDGVSPAGVVAAAVLDNPTTKASCFSRIKTSSRLYIILMMIFCQHGTADETRPQSSC